MCGIFGIAGDGICSRDVEAFGALMVFNVLRGPDSTGVFKTHRRGNAQKILKQAKASPIFFSENKDFIKDYMTYFMMGHCRDATVGTVNDKNAHPFMLSNSVGMHNGTLCDKKYRGLGITDSEALFKDIEDRGFKKVLEELDGNSAFAIVVYDRHKDEFYMARNSKRPLTIAVHKTSSVMYWSSEFEMLQFALKRLKIDADYYDITPGTLFKISVKDIQGGKKFWDHEDLNLKKPYDVKSRDYNRDFKSPKGKKSQSRLSVAPWDDGVSYDTETWDPISKTWVRESGVDTPVCCTCDNEIPDNHLGTDKIECVEVDGVKYYTCEKCTSEIRDHAKKEFEEGSINESGTESTPNGVPVCH